MAGLGTLVSPYMLYDAEDLATFARLVNEGSVADGERDVYVEQKGDIDLGNFYWQPIGDGRTDSSAGVTNRTAYNVQYRGNNFTISNMFSTGTAGLFYMAEECSINNLTIENGVFSGALSTAGGFISVSYGCLIENCVFEGKITSTATSSVTLGLSFGGIVGTAYTSGQSTNYFITNIENSTNKGKIVPAKGYVGGIVGRASECKIKNCVNTGRIQGSDLCVGGIIGTDIGSGLIINSYNIGEIVNSSTMFSSGGIAGQTKGQIINCFNAGTFTTRTKFGGILGSGPNAIADYCYYGGDCTAIVGVVSGSDIAVRITDLNTTSYAKGQSWFENVGYWNRSYLWDFDNIWIFKAGENNGFPVLAPNHQFTINFDKRGGTGGTNSVIAKPGLAMPSITPPSLTGNIFQGYYTGTNGSGTKYYNADGSSARNCDLSIDSKLYAHWTLITRSMQIGAYHPDGRLDNPESPTGFGWAYFDVVINDTLGTYTGTYKDQTRMIYNLGYGSTVVVSNIRPFKEGMHKYSHFTGTATDNGDGTYTFTTTASRNGMNIYMKMDSHLLTLNPNGGSISGSTSNLSYTQDYGTTRTLPVPTREGYIFKGWRFSGGVAGSNNSIGNLGKLIVGESGPFGLDNFFKNHNNVYNYNNSSNGNVILTRESTTLSQSPYNSHVMKITNKGSASPGLGGFAFRTLSYANAEFVAIFEAKIPVGYSIEWYTNQIGQGYGSSSKKWLTSTQGTGDWETYIHYVKSDASGTFSSTNYFAINGTAGTPENPVVWYLSQAAVYDCTGMGLNKDAIVSNLSKQTTYTYGTKDTILVAMWETDVWTRHASTSFAGGDGTASNPYQIANANQLAKLAKDSRSNNMLNMYFKQTANIDLSGHVWEGIGNSTLRFVGRFDGGYHSITNMKTSAGDYISSYAGLFALTDLRSDSIIQNVIIRDSQIEAEYDAGAITANGSTCIRNCIVENTSVKARTRAAGGIIGCQFYNTENCIVRNCTIESGSYAAGIVGCWGQNAGQCTDNAVIGATITGTNANAIAPTKTGCIVNACYTQGNVNGTASKIMYGDSTQWGNWTYNSGINNGYPVQSGLFWIGGQTGSVKVYNYLKKELGFIDTTEASAITSYTNGVYRDTGYTVNWNEDFSIETVFNINQSGKRFLIFGNFTTNSNNKCLNVEVTTTNQLRVYINNMDVGMTEANTIKPNENIRVRFGWSTIFKTWTIKAVGTNTNCSLSGKVSSVSGISDSKLRVGCQDNRGSSVFGDINTGKVYVTIGGTTTGY